MNILDMDSLLLSNAYPGRGIAVGTTPDGRCAVCAYFLTGRSANSRNRVLALHDGALFTEPFDPSRVEDPSLIIYAAMRQYENKLVVTNGDQTDTVVSFLKQGKTFYDALFTRSFEPDAPNFTPRISAILFFENGGFSYEMSILKSADENGTVCERQFFFYPAQKGTGHFIHTYAGNGSPLPSYEGEPKHVSIGQDIDLWSQALWNALDEDNKIALFVRYTDLQSGRYEERLYNKLAK